MFPITPPANSLVSPHHLRIILSTALLAGLGASAAGQDERPPEVEAFEQAATEEADAAGSGFRFTYPVRDANSGEVLTEEKPATVPSALSDSDLAAGLALPEAAITDTAPAGPAQAEAAADAFFSGVDDGADFTEVPDVGAFRTGRGPFRYTFWVQEGYNSNVNGRQNGGVSSMFTSFGAGIAYAFGTSRLQIETGLSAGATIYYNNTDLQNDGWFPTGNFSLAVNYDATPRLNLFFNNTTTLLAQPDFAVVGASNTYQGDYLVSGSSIGAEYQWLPKFATITSYSPVFWYYFEPDGDNFSRFEQTAANQFLFLWKPTTALVAEYRFNTRNYWYVNNYDSIGNFALLGFNHQLNPRSELVFRGGAEQRVNQIPQTGGTYNYIGPFGEMNFGYSLRPETRWALRGRYGTTASGLAGYNQDQQFLAGTSIAHAFGRRLTADAFFNFQYNIYDQPDNNTPDFNTSVFNTGVSASFAINQVWSLNAGYTYTGLVSSDDNSQGSYNQNIVWLGTAVNF